MNVLVINCGSSSLKYQLINSDTEDVLAKGLCERIGIDGRLVYQKAGLDKEITECAMPTHKEAIQFVLDALTNEKTGAIKSLKEVDAIGHRVVHGGEKFAASAVITDEMIAAVKECNDLAPLHNPANLIGIDVCSELMPGVPQVGVFDTAFHQTMPAKAYLYGLPIEYYKKYKVRRYGFHGTSHSFVSKRAVEFLGLDKDNSKVIVCHLGNGSSISAVQNGKCVDTTMGLTPLEGVVMGTRSGNIDPLHCSPFRRPQMPIASTPEILLSGQATAKVSCFQSFPKARSSPRALYFYWKRPGIQTAPHPSALHTIQTESPTAAGLPELSIL